MPEVAFVVSVKNGQASIKQLDKLGSAGAQSGKKAKKEFELMGVSMSKISKLAAGLGIGFGALQLAQVIRQWAQEAVAFEKEMANVSTLVDTATVDTSRMRQEVLALGGQLGSSTELARGLYQALSAGQEPGRAVEFVGQAAKFATAALTDTHTAVDVLTTVLNAYGLAASEAGHVSDVLFEIIKQGKTTGQELSGTLGRVIPVAAALGVSLEELGALLAGLTKGGFSTEEAVTSLRQVMVSFLSPQEQAVELAKNLGVELGVQTVKSEGLIPALRQLAEASNNNAEATSTFFGNVRALTGVLAVTKDQEAFVELLNEMFDVMGNTNVAAEKQLLTVGKQLPAFWENLTNAMMPSQNALELIAKSMKAVNDEMEKRFRKSLRDEEISRRATKYMLDHKKGYATASIAVRDLIEDEDKLRRLHGDLSEAIKETNRHVAEGNDQADVSLARTRSLQGNYERLVEEYEDQIGALDELGGRLPSLIRNRTDEADATDDVTTANVGANKEYAKLRTAFLRLLNPADELAKNVGSLIGEFSKKDIARIFKDEINKLAEAYAEVNRELPAVLLRLPLIEKAQIDLIGTTQKLNETYDAAFDTFGKVRSSQIDLIQTVQDSTEGLNAQYEAARDVSDATRDLNTDFEGLETQVDRSSREMEEFAKANSNAKTEADSLTDAISDQVSTIKTDFSRALVAIRHDWEGFWEALKSIANAALDALLRLMVEKGITELASWLGTILVGAAQPSGGGGQPWWKKVIGTIGTVLGGQLPGAAGGGGSPGATGQPPTPFGNVGGAWNPWRDPTFGYLPPISGENPYLNYISQMGLWNTGAMDQFLGMHGMNEMDLVRWVENQADIAQGYENIGSAAADAAEETEQLANETEELTEEMRALAYWGIDPTMDSFERGGLIWLDIIQKGDDLASMLYGLGTELLKTKDAGEAQRIAWDLLGGEILRLRDQYELMGLELPPLIQLALDWAEANGMLEGSLSGVDEAIENTKQEIKEITTEGKTFLEVMGEVIRQNEELARQGVVTSRTRTTDYPRFRERGRYDTIPGYVSPVEGTVYPRPDIERRGATINVTITGDNYGLDDLNDRIAEGVTERYREGGFEFLEPQ
jgi:TP901 family phage tail tape measure protein